MFFQDWLGLARTIIVGTLAYVALILLLRISGKRTLSKMNAFDFIVTVAMGSTLATILLTEDVALAEGVVALALLIGLQFTITWLSVRSPAIKKLVTSEPALLYFRGELLHDALRRERITEGEVRAVIRASGRRSFANVDAVVLETDGSMSVLQREPSPSGGDRQPVGKDALGDVRGVRGDA